MTVLVITHNNQDTLARCLESVRWAGECVVVDRGSTDKTLEIAHAFTDQVYSHPSASLACVQQFALMSARQDWILMLEPHDWVEEMLKHEIDGILANVDRQVDGYFLPVRVYFQGEWLRYGRLYPNHQLRLFRKQYAEVSTHVYHQSVQVSGELGYLENALGSEPYVSVDELFAEANVQSTRAAYAAFEEGSGEGFRTSLINIAFRPLLTTLNRLFLQRGILDGSRGWTFAFSEGYKAFLKYAKLRHHLVMPSW